jgi:phenylpropionate dioxygenase-like ring-hydroxylating dioxygenase large terminal subunit
MLSKEDNELITNTERGTPMGELFRRFWLPAALSSELPGPDCAPLRVKLLGEDLIAFRDTSGNPGLVDAYCPHRGAPMFFGRNEEDGLRCVYHGWKFDVTGACVDLPNAPEGETFKNKVRITAYPCVDSGGLVWAYMGPAGQKPPFPEFEWTKLPAENRYVTKFRLECNYLQAQEGDFDPSHGRFLHSTMDGNRNNPGNAVRAVTPEQASSPRAPLQNQTFDSIDDRRIKSASRGFIEDAPAGAWFVDTQERGEEKFAAANPWFMPIFTTSGISRSYHYSSNMRVPIDNKSLMFYRLRWGYQKMSEEDIAEYKFGGYTHPELVPGTWQTKANVHNDYEIDRVAQKYFTFTGIKTFPLQDIAMMENQWGPIADRTQEHLTSWDHQIIYIRRRLLKTAKALSQGVEPSEPWHPEAFRYHREAAYAPTLEEAIATARQKASASRVSESVAQQITV